MSGEIGIDEHRINAQREEFLDRGIAGTGSKRHLNTPDKRTFREVEHKFRERAIASGMRRDVAQEKSAADSVRRENQRGDT